MHLGKALGQKRRYYRASAAQYSEEHGIDRIAVLYSAQNFISDRNLVLLAQ